MFKCLLWLSLSWNTPASAWQLQKSTILNGGNYNFMILTLHVYVTVFYHCTVEYNKQNSNNPGQKGRENQGRVFGIQEDKTLLIKRRWFLLCSQHMWTSQKARGHNSLAENSHRRTGIKTEVRWSRGSVGREEEEQLSKVMVIRDVCICNVGT